MHTRLAALAAGLLLWGAPATAGAVTIDFEDLAPGTVVTNQYASAGGAGQGVVFGPLPGGAGDGLRPIIEAPGAGVASSGTQVASLANCPGCEFYIPNTTATFQNPRTTVRVRVGMLGPPTGTICLSGATAPQCSLTTLTVYDAAGMPLGSDSATLTQGRGLEKELEVTLPSASIVGLRISQRDNTDTNKPIAIDDLTFATETGTPPPAPDFSLTATPGFVRLREGAHVTAAIAIGRFNGSSGPIDLEASGMPEHVTAALDPDPAPADTATLTLTAHPGVAATTGQPPVVTVTGTPAGAEAGPAPRSTTVSMQIQRAFELLARPTAELDPCVTEVPVHVVRADGFTGPVSLSLVSTGGGIAGTLDGSVLRATGEATGRPLSTRFTITASSPGLPNRSVGVNVTGTCPEEYDARVTSMQITQGVQSPVLPLRSGLNLAGRFSYPSLVNPARLRRDGATAVRVYANLSSGPSGGVRDIPAVLHGRYVNGSGQHVALPGSPLLPVGGSRTLFPGGPAPALAEQTSEIAAYTFVLPTAWTRYGNRIDLRASVLDTTRPVQSGSAVAACHQPLCRINDSMEITHVPFTRLPEITIRPVRMYTAGQAFPDPQDVFAYARLAMPVPLKVEPYYGRIDVTDIANSTATSKAPAMVAALSEYMCDHSLPDPGWLVGVSTGVFNGVQADGRWCVAPPRSGVKIAAVEYRRPLSSTGHEVGHLFDLDHASNGCYGPDDDDAYADWPPDQMGLTHSVGLDLRQGSGIGGGPFALMSRPGANAFDLMSYCGDSGLVDDILRDPAYRNVWVSVRNWNKMFDQWKDFGRSAARVSRKAGTARPSLAVAGYGSGATATITSVAPVDARPSGASSSGFRLLGLSAEGETVADVPMQESALHVHGGAAPTALSAAVPAAGVVKVAIARDGAILAERSASASAPRVRLAGPPRFRGRSATIRWSQSDGDGDGDALRASVAYSRDGGRFERIWMGAASSISLPARLLPRAKAARVRVTVNDGFRQAVATSKPFRSPGAAPEVRIASPLPGIRQSAGAALVLTGEAFDDAGRALAGRRLTWRAGRRVLGRGESVTATGLGAGTRRVELVALDRHGRTGRASVRLRLAAATPFLTDARVVGRSRRFVELRVASSVPARLTVSGQRFRVGRSPQRVRVRVPRRARSLALRLAADGRASVRTVAIRRA